MSKIDGAVQRVYDPFVFAFHNQVTRFFAKNVMLGKALPNGFNDRPFSGMIGDRLVVDGQVVDEHRDAGVVFGQQPGDRVGARAGVEEHRHAGLHLFGDERGHGEVRTDVHDGDLR